MTLPSFLLAEVRLTFRLCAQQHAASRQRPLSTSFARLKKRTKANGSSKFGASSSSPVSSSLEEASSARATSSESRPSSSSLVPKQDGGKALESERRADVPMRVIPQAQVTAKAKLSPMQRLHIEHLTRHPPAKQAPKVYKERLLIYHFGIGRVNWLVFSRVTAIVALGFMTMIWVPAYYQYGTPLYIVGLVWAASFIPILFINWATRSIATEVWLRLPPVARQSPQAAMTYARNLPRDASIDVRFMRWTSHTGTVPINVVDTTPASSRLKPVSFKWIGPRVDKGTLFRPNPTEFFVRPKSAEGRAVRDTIPGLWSVLYKRLTGVDSNTVSKWRS